MSGLADLLVGMALFGNMLLSVFAFYLAHRTGKAIDTLERNTNSIKDALVASTAKASFSEGAEHERSREKS